MLILYFSLISVNGVSDFGFEIYIYIVFSLIKAHSRVNKQYKNVKKKKITKKIFIGSFNQETWIPFL